MFSEAHLILFASKRSVPQSDPEDDALGTFQHTCKQFLLQAFTGRPKSAHSDDIDAGSEDSSSHSSEEWEVCRPKNIYRMALWSTDVTKSQA